MEVGRGSYAQVFEVKHVRSACAVKELMIPQHYISNNTESSAAIKRDFFRICNFWSSLGYVITTSYNF